MTREEAIEAIKFGHCDDMYYRKEYEEAVDMAIKALEQEPCDDCISREAVDDYIAKLMSGYLYDEERTRLEEFSAYLWELPSVTPQPKMGKWIDGKCNRCGTHAPYWAMASTYYCSEYCPNCGCQMLEG